MTSRISWIPAARAICSEPVSFMAGCITEWPLEQKVKFACAAAGLSCQNKGPTNRPAGLEEIEALMRAQPR